MEVVANSYLPGDQHLVEKIVYELKSQGIFDQFRKECFADVDTKPAYQNLRQRVEGSVANFLKDQRWRPDMNKNQVREMLRKTITESGFLETGVERIVDQVVNPKINTGFQPKVEEVVYQYLGIEKPNLPKSEQIDLLPNDLEAVSPESESLDRKDEKNCDISQDLEESKTEEDESPPFEPLDEQSCVPLEENSVDSHMSGFSGLVSHESDLSNEHKVTHMEQDSQMSRNSSDSRLSIITSDENSKIDTGEDSFKSVKSDSNSKPEDKTDKNKHKSSERYKSRNESKSDKDKDGRSSKDQKSRHSFSTSSKDKENDRDKNRDRKESRSELKNNSGSKNEKSKEKGDKDRNRASSSKLTNSSNKDKDKEKCEKVEKEKVKLEKDKLEKSDKDKSKSDKAIIKTDKVKSENEKDKSRSGNNRSKQKDKSSDSKSKDKSSSSDKYRHSSHSEKHKKYKDKKKNYKPKDDHYSSRDKKNDRRSTDRDSNDGHSNNKLNLSNPTSDRQSTSQSQNSGQDTQHGSGDSGNSDQGESTNTPGDLSEAVTNSEIVIRETQRVKVLKPKCASNMKEAMRLMKIRKQLAKLEKKNQLGLASVDVSSSVLLSASIDLDEIKPNGLKKNKNRNNEDIDATSEEEEVKLPLSSTVTSQDKWDEMEAKLREEINSEFNEINEDESLNDSIEYKTQIMQTDASIDDERPCKYFNFVDCAKIEFLSFAEQYIVNIEKSQVIPTSKTPKKRKSEDSDLKNNNNKNLKIILEKKKKFMKKTNNAIDISTNEKFPLPLSPAESDKSLEPKVETPIVPFRPKRNNLLSSQRYSSDDLYKPRPTFASSRRRSAKITDN